MSVTGDGSLPDLERRVRRLEHIIIRMAAQWRVYFPADAHQAIADIIDEAEADKHE